LPKKSAVLFATDLASRGLDFPNVDWVIQVDCPEDPQTYIHRVGRTARNHMKGKGLLFLLESEKKMIPLLELHKIPMQTVEANTEKLQSVQGSLEAAVAQDIELKYIAQKAFISYMRSIYLAANKEIFNISKLPVEEYAKSLGLSSTPILSFTKGKRAKDTKKIKLIYKK